MKRLVVSYIFLALSLFAGKTFAQNLRTLFVDMPEHIMPLLTQNDRRDCIDFLDAGMRAVVTNRLDGKSELLEITDNYLRMNLSGSSSMQIKLLPYGGDTILCVVNTVSAEASDSRVNFYNRKWEALDDAGLFVKPQVSDFIVASDSLPYYKKMADMHLVALSLYATSDSMKAEFTMPAYMVHSDSVKIVPHLRPIIYYWSGCGFVCDDK